MKRRKFVDVVGYDYESKEEYEKHIPIMKKKGWMPCENTGWGLNPKEINDEKWKFCAYFYRDLM